MPANRLQRLIEDYLDSHAGETYASIARRGGWKSASTVQNIATTERRRTTPHPDTIRMLAKGLEMSFDEVKVAAGDAAGYGPGEPGERDALLVELDEYAAPLSEERKRELIALARFMMQQTRDERSGGRT